MKVAPLYTMLTLFSLFHCCNVDAFDMVYTVDMVHTVDMVLDTAQCFVQYIFLRNRTKSDLNKKLCFGIPFNIHCC